MNRLVVIAMLASGCMFDELDGGDYATPAVGGLGAATVLDCQSVRGRYEPCGWVYYFPSVELEFCLIWDDRAQVLGYPVKMINAARSLYGDCEKSTHTRFAGSPVCRYTCPPERGCNATGSCFCLDET